MVRTQVRFEVQQHEKLRTMARQRSTTVSQLVRQGVDLLIAEAERARRWRRLMQAVGTSCDRHRAVDVAERHDAYLPEVYCG